MTTANLTAVFVFACYRMKISLLSTFLLLSVVSMTTVSARSWKIGDNGLVRWDNNCDFYGFDIGQRASGGDQCGGICIANSRCTHFTHAGGICFLKRNTRGWRENNSGGAVCGFITGRSSQSIQSLKHSDSSDE